MDTSKEYTAMCDCPEIQGQWKPIAGDWVYSIRDGVSVIDTLTIRLGKFLKRLKHDFIHLPRQDQLQKMLADDDVLDYSTEELIGGFASYALMEENSSVWSMEQLWLAFYMKEKHQKTWSGMRW